MWKNLFFALCTFALISLTSSECLAQRNRTRSGTAGGTATSTGQVQRNGGGNYSNSGHKSWTGPNGKTGSATTTGNGQVTGAPGEGVNNSYNGQVTTGKGSTYHVDHEADYQYDQEEGVTRDGSTEVTNDQGQTVGSGSSSGSAKYGEGYQSERTQTGPQGHTTTKNVRGGKSGSGTYRNVER